MKIDCKEQRLLFVTRNAIKTIEYMEEDGMLPWVIEMAGAFEEEHFAGVAHEKCCSCKILQGKCALMEQN